MRHDSAEPVLLDVADAVARLTLNRPYAGNAINAELGRRFRAHAESLVGRDDVRAILLTGTGAPSASGAIWRTSQPPTTPATPSTRWRPTCTPGSKH